MRKSSAGDVPPNQLGDLTAYLFIFSNAVRAPWHRRPVEQGGALGLWFLHSCWHHNMETLSALWCLMQWASAITSAYHYSDVTLVSWHLKSLATQLFVQAHNKGNIKVPHNWRFGLGIHQWLVDSPHKGPVLRNAFPCHDIIMPFDIKMFRNKKYLKNVIFQITYFCQWPMN